ncbi:NitT/TauT family transport system substrate-binding protein [Humitalea rosea]|uniref:Thiamine pyrimidine synthase n=1 Tax=Humitalea rosea TaxID=990373 RepID=A0A2W7IQE6_9PROT|nr:ABC transporter substrate-binding protein [Humitalea rosea]PZW48397.1 NitT/TauT family transport system substrate-binding protein [Humitalea rosea]
MHRRTLLATPLAVLAAPRIGQAQALTPVTLRLKWLPQAQFAGFYLAVERGYYREAGLDLSISPGGPNLLTENLVASGSEQFGLSGGTDSVFSAREKGLPITCIGVAHQVTPFVFVAKADGPVKTLEDFRGKKVTAWFTGAHLVLFGMLASRNIPRDALSISPQQVSITPFINGDTDVCAATWYNELNTIKARIGGADKLKLFVAEDYGITVPRDTVIVNEAFAAANPNAVTAFLRASIRGWKAAKAEPAAALEAVMKIVPTLDRAHQIAMLPEVLRLMEAGAAAQQGLFVIDPTAIKKAHDFFVEQQVLKAPIDLATAFRSSFLEAIPLADRLA